MKCSAPTESGRPCRFVALDDDGLCIMHSKTPDAETARADRGRAGGTATAKVKTPPIPTADGLLDTREKVIAYLSRYKASPKYGPAAARIANAALAAINTPEMKALEAENERLRRIIEKHIPAARPLLADLRLAK